MVAARSVLLAVVMAGGACAKPSSEGEARTVAAEPVGAPDKTAPAKKQTRGPGSKGAPTPVAASGGGDGAGGATTAAATSIADAFKTIESPVPPLDEAAPAQEIQLGFKPARISFLGWTEDGRRFALKATHQAKADTDDRYTIVLRQVHDAVTGQMIDSYRVSKNEGAGASASDPVVKAWRQARPSAGWKTFAAETRLVSVQPFRKSPAGTAEFHAALDGDAPHGSKLTISPVKEGFDTTWTNFQKEAASGRTRLPKLRITLARGSENWESIAYRSGTDYQYMWEAAAGNPRARVDTTMRAHWSPLGDRVVWVMAEHERGVRDGMITADIARFYVRSAGPQIKVVNAGVGDELSRQAAAILDHNRLPVTILEQAANPSPVSKIYYRGGAPGKALAARISELLPGNLPSEELTKDGWVHAIVVLGE